VRRLESAGQARHVSERAWRRAVDLRSQEGGITTRHRTPHRRSMPVVRGDLLLVPALKLLPITLRVCLRRAIDHRALLLELVPSLREFIICALTTPVRIEQGLCLTLKIDT
jgi:hypothetical protein